MPGKEIEAGKFEIRYEGIADVSKILKDVYNLLASNDYKPQEGNFVQKSIEPGVFYIEAEHKGEKKIRPYIVCKVTVNYIFLEAKDVDVKKDNKILKLQKTRCIINISGNVITDPTDKFNTKIKKFFRKIYDDYIIKSDLGQYAGELENFLLDIKKKIQSNFIN